MLFNSFAFAVFLPIVYVLYWLVARRSRTARNVLLLAASYLFYGWWDWRFLGLIVGSSAVDYIVGAALGSSESKGRRRALLGVSIAVNLGALGIFKYYDFFMSSAVDVLSSLGFQAHPATLQVVLPVGISFYTFQTLSYSIDVYRQRMEPSLDPVAFFAFVAFFPQLVAGPIERASHLLPQFQSQPRWDLDAARDGLRRMLWGLFKKAVIADNLAPFVDSIFDSPGDAAPQAIALATFYFAMQIYCDFSGYSDIAIGTARLFGFTLMDNFRFPYFSRGIGEFWRRWHISLSTWFRDYVYIPLGGSRGSPLRSFMTILATFIISGLWHGANWTFVAWGAFHGLLYVPRILLGARGPRDDGVIAAGRWLPGPAEFARASATFALVCVGWVFFRAASVSDALEMLGRVVSQPWGLPSVGRLGVLYCAPVLAVEWVQRERAHGLEIAHLPRPWRHAVYYALAVAIFLFAATGHVPFIYFQF